MYYTLYNVPYIVLYIYDGISLQQNKINSKFRYYSSILFFIFDTSKINKMLNYKIHVLMLYYIVIKNISICMKHKEKGKNKLHYYYVIHYFLYIQEFFTRYFSFFLYFQLISHIFLNHSRYPIS